jgi:hypothetical protein
MCGRREGTGVAGRLNPTGSIFALAALGLVASGAARAGDYWIVANNDRQIELVDPGRVAVAPHRYPRIWTIVVRRAPMPTGPAFDYIQEYREMDCTRRRTAIIRATFHTRDGTRLGESDAGSVAWLPETPKSQGEAVLDFVCAKPAARRRLGLPLAGLTLQQAIDSLYASWPSGRPAPRSPKP